MKLSRLKIIVAKVKISKKRMNKLVQILMLMNLCLNIIKAAKSPSLIKEDAKEFAAFLDVKIVQLV